MTRMGTKLACRMLGYGGRGNVSVLGNDSAKHAVARDSTGANIRYLHDLYLPCV